MYGRHRLRGALPLLACVLVLVAQVMGMHLHMCLDGAQPSISTHLTAVGEHGDHHHGDPHPEVDVAWVSGGPAKPHGGFLGALPALLAVLWLASVLYPASGPRPRAGVSRPVPLTPLYLRPLLRGPPLHAS